MSRYRRRRSLSLADVVAVFIALAIAAAATRRYVSGFLIRDVIYIEYGATVLVPLIVVVVTILLIRGPHRRRLCRQTLREFRWNPRMSPEDFEKHCADYLRLRGWHARLTPRTGDQGGDVVARRRGDSIVIQCKHWQGAVGNHAVQEVVAARGYYKVRRAAVVSSSQYTKAARALAKANGVLLLSVPGLSTLAD